MFDETFVSLEAAMRRAAQIHEVHAQNIANINTPNYVPLDFDEVLQKAVKKADKKMTLEEEMAKLSKNSLEYSGYVKLLTQKVNVLKTIASQGRR